MLLARIKKIFEFFWSANWYKTIIFNFTMLPFQEAIQMPIWLYGKVDISRCTGVIKWLPNTKLHTGGWRIGTSTCVLNGIGVCQEITVLSIEGTLILGEHGFIANGCRMYIKKGATIEMGDRIYINEHFRICAYTGIKIGHHVRISWDSQIFDTDFHYLKTEDGWVYPRSKKVEIGDRVWLGNHITVAKGACLGNGNILASHSLLRNDFGEVANGVFAGIPAKLKKTGFQRVIEEEQCIAAWFDENPNAESYKIDF